MKIEINNAAQFEQEIKQGKVLVDFYATWCGPCKMLSPIIDQVEREHPDLKVLKIDVDEVGDLAMKFNVSSIPTLLHFEDGKLVDSKLGYMPKPMLEQFLQF